MRTTKLQLESIILSMEKHYTKRMIFVRTNDQQRLRELPGFIPVEQYARAVPQRGELGCDSEYRFFSEQMQRWTS